MRYLREPRAIAAILVATAVVVASILLLARSGDDEDGPADGVDQAQVAEGFEEYCEEVEERRAQIGAAVAAGPQTGLIRALPSFKALAAKAPDDIRDEWDTVIEAIEDLVDAFDEAGADPASYDLKNPPADVSAADRDAIQAAAVALGSQSTRAALAGVDQQARDVCKTPLSL